MRVAASALLGASLSHVTLVSLLPRHHVKLRLIFNIPSTELLPYLKNLCHYLIGESAQTG